MRSDSGTATYRSKATRSAWLWRKGAKKINRGAKEEIDLKQILADQKERTILKATPDDDITEGQAQRLAELPRSHELSKRAKECNEALDRIIRSKTQNDKVCGLMEEAIMRSIDTALHHHVLEHSLSCLVSGNH